MLAAAALALAVILAPAAGAVAQTVLHVKPPPSARDDQCGGGYHWSAEQECCLRDQAQGSPCAAGYYWSAVKGRCIRHGDGPDPCPRGKRWDASKKRCVASGCPKGFHWSGTKGYCVPDRYLPGNP